ncbi:hypothetical protein Vi05172_g10088 [Venturia inaequalis]|nr:hypothetical protein Vi05172_g10088 [Venturia inaequalis]
MNTFRKAFLSSSIFLKALASSGTPSLYKYVYIF